VEILPSNLGGGGGNLEFERIICGHPRDSHSRMIMLARTSNNCTTQIHSFVSESAGPSTNWKPFDSNTILVFVPRWCLAPRETGRLIVGGNMTDVSEERIALIAVYSLRRVSKDEVSILRVSLNMPWPIVDSCTELTCKGMGQ
jgi:hypothetical protein